MSLSFAVSIEQEFDNLQQKHKDLVERAQNMPLDDESFEGSRDELLNDINELLDGMKGMTCQPIDAKLFTWLSDATAQWQTIYSEVFHLAEDIRERVGICSIPDSLEPALPPFGEVQIRYFLEKASEEVSQSRKLTYLYRQLQHLKHHRGSIHRAMPSTEEEMRGDWYEAQVHLICNLLASGREMSQRSDATIFPYLEKVWLDDVKRLQAYRVWERTGTEWDPCPERHYIVACEKLRKLVVGHTCKGGPAALMNVRKYITDRYLVDGRVPLTHRAAEELVATKAFRLWQLSGEAGNAGDHWKQADRFVKEYYENILGATTGDSTAVRAVVNVIRQLSLVNAFEAFVYMFFVSFEDIEKVTTERWRLI